MADSQLTALEVWYYLLDRKLPMVPRTGIACVLLLLSFSAPTGAQSVPQSVDIPLQAPVTAADNAFAQSLLDMTPDEASAVVAQSPASQITIGLATAMRDAGIEFIYNRPLKALDIYRKALAVADRLGAPLMQANILFCVADSYRIAGDIEQALAFYDRSSAVYAAANAGPVRLAKPLTGKGLARLTLGDYEGAIEADRTALKLDEEQATRSELRAISTTWVTRRSAWAISDRQGSCSSAGWPLPANKNKDAAKASC